MQKQERLLKLNNENYYSAEADLAYWSVSQYKAFMKCESEALARLTGYEPKLSNNALLLGSYVDAYWEGTLEQFKAEHPEILNSRTGKPKADFAKADEMIRRTSENEKFSKYMEGDKQAIFTGEIFGVNWKCKLDSYSQGKRITDLKTCAKIENIGNWGYHFQGAIYQKLVEINTGEKLPFYLACVSKEEVPDMAIIQIPQSILDDALMCIEENIVHLDSVKQGLVQPERCESCDYCKKTKELKVLNYADFM